MPTHGSNCCVCYVTDTIVHSQIHFVLVVFVQSEVFLAAPNDSAFAI